MVTCLRNCSCPIAQARAPGRIPSLLHHNRAGRRGSPPHCPPRSRGRLAGPAVKGGKSPLCVEGAPPRTTEPPALTKGLPPRSALRRRPRALTPLTAAPRRRTPGIPPLGSLLTSIVFPAALPCHAGVKGRHPLLPAPGRAGAAEAGEETALWAGKGRIHCFPRRDDRLRPLRLWAPLSFSSPPSLSGELCLGFSYLLADLTRLERGPKSLGSRSQGAGNLQQSAGLCPFVSHGRGLSRLGDRIFDSFYFNSRSSWLFLQNVSFHNLKNGFTLHFLSVITKRS